jgi:hypothetical protein
MRFHADLHVHSKYSRATSRDLDLEHLAAWAARKGIGVVATGDFSHPAWRAELKEKLRPAEPGLFRLCPEIEQAVAQTLPPACQAPVRFMLEVEISTIYKKGEKTRKVHHLIYAPDFATVDRISERLARIGNIASDGRPILGLDSRDLLEITLTSSPDASSLRGAQRRNNPAARQHLDCFDTSRRAMTASNDSWQARISSFRFRAVRADVLTSAADRQYRQSGAHLSGERIGPHRARPCR